MIRKVHLHGRLGTKFGKLFELDVDSPQEAFRALSFMVPGFREYISKRKYVVSTGSGVVLDAEQLPMRLGAGKNLHLTPAGLVTGLETILLIGTLLLTGISVIGVLTMPKAPKASDREDATKTASFIFDGATNSTEQGNPIALNYGLVRVGSVVGSAGISTTDVTEATVASDPTNPIPYVPGTGGGSYDFFVGMTPGIRQGEWGDEWVTLEKGGKAGSGGARAAKEDPNSLRSQATAKILDIIGEGEIVGLVDGLKSVYFDETPLQNADGTFNFSGVAVEQRVGLPDQDFIPGFSAAENTVGVDTEVSVLLGPVTRTVSNAQVTVARVTIRLPQLFKQDTTNGDLKTTSVTVKISVQADGGGFTDVATMTFDGKTNSGYQRSLDIRLPNGTERQVRVTRVTADSELASLSDETRFDLLTEVIEAKLSYPDTALIGLTVDARQFGTNIPNRSYLIKGLIIEVPSNYDPVTRAYTGVWDGTFVRAWTNNPAWVFRDIIINRRYGLGTRIGATVPDKWALYAIAQYNDELVPDGFGGTQPRYTINCSITNQTQAYDVIASIASNFRGWAYWGPGSIVPVQDRPEDPSILVTPANVVDGTISYGRATPLEKRRSVAIVYWNDPEDGYRLTPEVYEVPELVRRFGRRTGDEVTAFGVTNRGQAHRMCRWMIEDESQGSNTTARYEVGDDHGFVEPGRIAAVADPMFTTSRRGGRVRSATANQVVLDAPTTLVSGQTYTLRVTLRDGTTSVRPVSTGAGTTDTLNLGGTAYTQPPLPGAVWTVESNVTANRQFRVKAIETDEPPYKVQALLHDPTKYARVEFDRDLTTANFLELPSGPIEQPSGLVATEFLLPKGNASVPAVQFSWNLPLDPRVSIFQAEYMRPTQTNWEQLDDSSSVTRVVEGTEAGTWLFRARSVTSLGQKTGWRQTEFALDGQIDTMPEVVSPGLSINSSSFTAQLVWTAPDDMRPLRYEVLYHASSTSLGSAVSLGVTDQLSYTILNPGNYWVRTRFIDFVSAAPTRVNVPDVIFSAGIVPYLTNEAFVLQAAADGTVSSYSGASGSYVVMSGTTDVSSSFTLSTPSGGNPQGLTVAYTDRAYLITAGLDAGEPTATLRIRATGSGTYAGVVLDKVFSLSKSRQGVTGEDAINNVNLIRDPLFQKASTEWSSGVAGGVISTGFPSIDSAAGYRYYKVAAESFSGGAGRFIVIRQTSSTRITCVPGQRYAFQCKVEGQSLGGTLANQYLRVQWYNSSNAFISETNIQTLGGPQTIGTLMSGFDTAPSGAALMEFVFYADTGTTGQISALVAEPIITVATAAQTAFPAFAVGPTSGADALSVTASSSSISVPCTASGTPKDALQGFSFTAYKGATNVTATSTGTSYSITATSNLSGITHVGNGVFTVSGIAADMGYVDVTITNGSSQVVRVAYTKAKDGAAFVRAEDPSISGPSDTSYITSSTILLLAGPNGTFGINFNGGFTADSSSGNLTGYVEISPNGSSWTYVGDITSFGAAPSEPGSFLFNASIAGGSYGVSSKTTVRVRLLLAQVSTFTMDAFVGSGSVEWAA